MENKNDLVPLKSGDWRLFFRILCKKGPAGQYIPRPTRVIEIIQGVSLPELSHSVL